MAYTFGQHVPCAMRKLQFVHARMFRWWFHPCIAKGAALRRIAIQTALHRQHLCRSQYVVRYAHRRSHLRLIFNRMKCAMRYAETSVYPCQHVPAASPIHSKKGVILAAHRYAGRVAQAALLPLTICGARCVSHKFPHPIFNMMKCAMPTARATSAALRMSAIMGYALTCAPHKRALSKSRPPL